MKTVAIIYRNRDNAEAIEHLRQNVIRVFGSYIQVENYFLNEIPADEMLEADAFVVVNEDMLYPLKKHINNFYKVILMNRSINRKYITEILDLPRDTDVLVVNDSYESTIQTTYAFYELGISHVNFIPYDEALEDTGVYRHIEVAVTPDEEELVPPYVRRIVNIGYREISFDTLLKLMRKLDLNLEVVNRNLIRHIHSVVEPNTDFHSNYLDSYLKSQMLNRVIHDSPSAILVTNDEYQLVYSNDRANTIFSITDGAYRDLETFMDTASMAAVFGGEEGERLLGINGENYLFEKSPIMLMDQIVGYCLTFQNEKDLRDLEINLGSHLRKKGMFAKYQFKDIIHQSFAMKQCLATAKKAAVTDYTILIRGESGTGKELLAQSIHNYSKRKNAPFIAVNCAALPEALLESELFGYEGGSFTGARKSGKLGLFEQAQTGTIFLDEVGDISPNLQSRLLRTIQEKQVMRIGSDKIINVDIRVIAATNKDLEEEVRRGNFRSDLFYRLNVIPVFIEPLRNRREDILPLLQNFLGNLYGEVTSEEKEILLSYGWPGNVRELESTAIYYKTLARFPEHLRDNPGGNGGAERTAARVSASAGDFVARDRGADEYGSEDAGEWREGAFHAAGVERARAGAEVPFTGREAEGVPAEGSAGFETQEEPGSAGSWVRGELAGGAAETGRRHNGTDSRPGNGGNGGIDTAAAGGADRVCDRAFLRDRILQIVADHSQAYHGIGRSSLAVLLKKEQIAVGDGKLRDVLKELEEERLIEISRGRSGSRILPEGVEYLRRRCQTTL